MTSSELMDNIMLDLKIELKDEFDRNFERKGFFSQAWEKRKFDTGAGSLMMRTGRLRRSIIATVNGTQLVFSSDVPYAKLMNEGGNIIVTRRMKRFFWAMYYKHSGRVRSLKSGRQSKSKASTTNNAAASFYKAMALKKEGSRISIPARRFMGDGPEMALIIKSVIETDVKEYFDNLKIVNK
jgi:phage gpG-like protein